MTLTAKPVNTPDTTNSLVTLFVEGKENSLDPKVLKELFADLRGKNVVVSPVGSCNSVKSVAEAFRTLKENWFFLVDRDHYHYNETEELNWDQFAEGKTNLLRWHKRELENYFLDANFLTQLPPKILSASKDAIEERVLTICQNRLFLDVANYVIASIRIEMRNDGVEFFRNTDIQQFHSCGDSLQVLLKLSAWNSIQLKVSQLAVQDEIKQRFNYYHQTMTGDSGDQLALRKGEWLNMISGKHVLNELVNNSGFFLNNVTVDDVARQLLKVPNVELPNDFIDLKDTVIQRAKQIIK